MPGVADTLAILRSRPDLTLGLLTGNYTRAIPIKLGAIGVNPAWFEITAFGDEGESRAALVAVAIGKYAARSGAPVDPRRVIVIGDTPRDVDCARANGCISFAVATGKFDVEALRAAGADVVVPDLSDPEPLLRLCE
jgi:phosphoglycolate phosphatase-like HAD superfamily hydrolase